MIMLGRSQEESREIITGALVLLAAIVIALALHLRPAGATSGYDLQARMAKTDGLSKGAEVRVSGVRIGTVTDMVLDPVSYLATVHMNINDDIRIPVDSALEVTSGGILGNLYVSIFPGKATAALQPGGLILKSCGAEDVMALIGRVGLSGGQGSCKR
jgi:phospholipid/cholesterol/gamma-HCH transport system substrate-binding protein